MVKLVLAREGLPQRPRVCVCARLGAARSRRSCNCPEGDEMQLGLTGKRAIVTGASRGIGYETARLFLKEGARVLICARDGQKLDAARNALAKETGGEVHAIAADMSRETDVTRMVESARQQLGGVDILVNNAGTMYSGRFAVLTEES